MNETVELGGGWVEHRCRNRWRWTTCVIGGGGRVGE